jgi:SiaC family regulatory phosphoprotein
MYNLIVEGTEDTPKIVFDIENSNYEISGRSLPEDVLSFYTPVLEWFDSFAKSSKDSLKLNIKLEYFNTASSKILLDIFMKLEEVKDDGKHITIDWYYLKADIDMYEAGVEYSELVSVPFELISL